MPVNNNLTASTEIGAIMAARTLNAIRTEGQQQLELIQSAKPALPVQQHLGRNVNLIA
ncbi:MAG: hypothetical protein SFV15_20555 [Polyangiaceae bacterium]|nr:hypothetical protein [Polyangiaceae bacterium]